MPKVMIDLGTYALPSSRKQQRLVLEVPADEVRTVLDAFRDKP